jgi:hypothetical protein
MYEIKPYTNHRDWPAHTVYIGLSPDVPAITKISCMYCKTTICRIAGYIDKVVPTPLPLEDFSYVTEVFCKTCKQVWLMAGIPPEFVHVVDPELSEIIQR